MLTFREAVPILGGQILMRNLAQAFTDEWSSPSLPERIAGAARQTIGRLSQVLDEGPFLAGDMFTLADAAVAPLFDYLIPLPECDALIAPASALRSWWQRILNRESLQNAPPKELFAVLRPDA